MFAQNSLNWCYVKTANMGILECELKNGSKKLQKEVSLVVFFFFLNHMKAEADLKQRP